MSEPTMDDSDPLEFYVHSPTFDKDCRFKKPLPDDGDSDYYSSYHCDVREEEDSFKSSRYDVSNLEAYLYYTGIRGSRRRGPKLIFRTSKDTFKGPSGPFQHVCPKQLLPVYEHHKLGKDDLWATIRSEVVELLDQRNIRHSSVDLVRFCWVEDKEHEDVKDDDDNDKDDEDIKEDDDNDEDDEDIKEDDDNDKDDEDIKEDDDNDEDDVEITPYGTLVTTPVTIWVGVLPDTLTGEVAFHSSNDILDLLKKHGISDIDVAYRESVVRGFSGPELFAPVWDFNPLKAVIDPVTTALGLPIAGLKTLKRRGTMGFYFRVDQDLYAVTARHVLFPEDEGNGPYSYVAGPKKEVILMGTDDFANFLTSIQSHIGSLNIMVDLLESRLTARSEGAEEVACELVKTQKAIRELKKFFVKVKKEWKQPKDRVIGHVVWAPPVSVSTTPHSYTKDVCVVKLDKKKFLQNFRGNVLDLGPEIGVGEFTMSINPRINASSDFKYPLDRLLKLQGILSAKEIRTPTNKDRKGNPMRYVIKRGLATSCCATSWGSTPTTIGCLTGFESHVRRYFTLGSRNSVEVAVYPYDNESGPFSSRGDSGSIIVDPLGKFVALLTSGTGPTDSSDITYGSPMHWLWEIIRTEFPGANLSFEDHDN